MEEERDALGGQVFDVLGGIAFENCPLRDLIVEAIRYGDRPEVRARLTRVVDKALDRQHLQELLEQRALASEVMDVVRVREIRAEMERAQGPQLEPLHRLVLSGSPRTAGRQYYQREPHRYEITHVPEAIRNRPPPRRSPRYSLASLRARCL